MSINIPLMRSASWAANMGITRFIPGISNSDAIKYGTLTDKEKEIYKAVFYSRTATVTMINETECVKENAKKVNNMGVPQLPMLLFISDVPAERDLIKKLGGKSRSNMYHILRMGNI